MLNLNELDIHTPKAKDNTSSGNRNGGITFVYHTNGKRIVLSKRILELLQDPERVSISYSDQYLFLAPERDEHSGYTLKKMSGQKVIYNAPLIKELLEHFGIDCSGNVCITFSDVEETDGDLIALNMQSDGGKEE